MEMPHPSKMSDGDSNSSRGTKKSCLRKFDQLRRLSDVLQMQVTDKVSVRSPKLLRLGSIPKACAKQIVSFKIKNHVKVPKNTGN